MRSLLLVATGAALLAGCMQTTSRYPSLQPRAIEGVSFAEPERPKPVVRPDPDLDGRIAALQTTLDTIGRDFAAAAREAETRVARARGQAPGTGPWLDAQTALSVLDGLKARAAVALGDLDQLAIDRGAAGLPDYPALAEARARAASQVDAQQARAAVLEAALPS